MANGSIAQLGEHLPYKQRVTGSSPVVPTIICGCSSSGRAPPCQGGGSGFEPRHPLQEKDIDFGVFYFYIYISYIYMRRARKGRFAVGEFKQSCELFERLWACRQAGAKPSEPRHPLRTKGHSNGVLFVLYADVTFKKTCLANCKTRF